MQKMYKKQTNNDHDNEVLLRIDHPLVKKSKLEAISLYLFQGKKSSFKSCLIKHLKSMYQVTENPTLKRFFLKEGDW
jgi:hypothetical protein